MAGASDAAPPVTTSPARSTTASAYGLAALAREIEVVSSRPVGCRNNGLNRARSAWGAWYYKVGKFVRFRPADLDAFVEAGRQDPVDIRVHMGSPLQRRPWRHGAHEARSRSGLAGDRRLSGRGDS